MASCTSRSWARVSDKGKISLTPVDEEGNDYPSAPGGGGGRRDRDDRGGRGDRDDRGDRSGRGDRGGRSRDRDGGERRERRDRDDRPARDSGDAKVVSFDDEFDEELRSEFGDLGPGSNRGRRNR